MYRRSETDIRNAFHEAGHALVALGFGVELSRVTIVPDTGRAGHVQMLADSRGWGSDEQQVTIYAAGRAGEEIGPFLRDDAWTKDTRYRSDLETIEELLPGCSEQDVRRAVDMAKECIRAWPYTFDNIVETLLRSGSLDERSTRVRGFLIGRNGPCRSRFYGSEHDLYKDRCSPMARELKMLSCQESSQT